jgi:predicted RND superfamily exporter protein
LGISRGLNLPVSLSLTDLLPGQSKSVLDMEEVTDDIGGAGHLNILIGPTKNPEKYLPIITKKLKSVSNIKYVYFEREEYSLKDKSLYLMDKKEFKKLVKHSKALFNNGDFIDFGLEGPEEKIEKIKVAKSYFKNLKIKKKISRFFLSKNKKYVMCLVKPNFHSMELGKSKKMANDIRKVLESELGKNKIPFQLSGRFVEKINDSEQFKKDMLRTGTISLVAIGVILYLGLGTLTGVLLTLCGVVLAMGWTLGLAHIFVGQINILTGFLLAILSGLGAEYGIHLIRRFYQNISFGYSKEEAVFNTYLKMGRTLYSAAITSASAFLILSFSDFRGFSELGIIAGCGVLSIYIVYMLFFPFMAYFLPKDRLRGKYIRDIFGFYPIKKKWMIPLIFMLPFLFYGIKFAEFEYNFERMHNFSKKTQWFNDLTDELFGKALTPTAILAKDKKEAKKLRGWLLNPSRKGTIDQAVSLYYLVPDHIKKRKRKLLKLKKRLDRINDSEIFEKTGIAPHKIKSWLSEGSYSRHDLPIQLKSAFGKSGNIVIVYPKERQGSYQTIFRYGNVLKEAQTLFPEIKIGSDTLVFLEILQKIMEDGKIVLLMFLVGAFFIFWIDFKSSKTAFSLECQLIFGLLVLVCLMGIFKVRFTIMNVAMVPAVLAAGVDMGVHVKHRELSGTHALESAKFVAQPVQLAMLTTMLGFGSLFFAEAKMLQGIAWISLLGQISMYFVCMVMTPVLKDSFMFFSLNHLKKNENLL